MGSLPIVIGSVVIVAVAVGLYYAKTARARENDRLREHAEAQIRQMLEGVAGPLGGTLVQGPALQTSAGRLVLLATRAPQHPEIDVVKFIAPLGLNQQLTLIPVEDAAKALQTKNLHPVGPDDPGVASAYKLLASDDAFAKSIATPKLVERLKEVDQAVRGRSRLQIAPSGATVLVAKGLSEPADLRAFYEKSVAVIDCLRALSAAGPS